MELFTISCTTCQARLKVRDVSAIGEILACPRCQSMVQVVPPAGWQPPPKPAPAKAADLDSAAANTARDAVVQAKRRAALAGLPETIDDSQIQRPADDELHALRPVRGFRGNLAAPENAAPAIGSRDANSAAPHDDDDPSPRGIAVAHVEHRWQKRWLFAGVPAAATCLLVLGLWMLFGGGRPDDVPNLTENGSPSATPAVASNQPARAAAGEPSLSFVQRWMPHDTRLIIAVHPAELSRDLALESVLARSGSFWQQLLIPLRQTFRLPADGIRRLTWANTDLNDLPNRSVVVIELAQPLEDDAVLLQGSEKLDDTLENAVCHRFGQAAWKHPFAVIDERTIVTGPRDLLLPLARPPAEPVGDEQPPAIFRALAAADPALPLTIGLDLAALRAFEAAAAPAWLTALPPLRQAWNALRSLPIAMIVGARLADPLQADLHLICRDESSALNLHAALGAFGKTADESLVQRDALIAEQLQSGEITVEIAGQRKLLLDQAAAALAARKLEIEGDRVSIRSQWSGSAALLASAAIAAVPAWENQRLAAARTADEAQHRKLLAGLESLEKAEGKLPAGAAGLPLVPAENRLSWLATMLPYYGHLDWHQRLVFSRSWNDPANMPVTQQPLDLLVNPALTAGTNKQGFPVTHYVGLAGLGANAAELTPDDPRAGLFGSSRRVGRASLGDGASHTIATLGVTGKLGPWAAGGESTIRAFTQEPYINGPDGFGSGQRDGMLAGMADGSVRFLSSKMSPRVIEQLATLHSAKPAHIPGFDPPPAAVANADPPTVDPPMPKPQPGAPANAPQVVVKPNVPAAEPAKQAKVDFAARLADKIPSIELRNVKLSDLVRFLSMLSAVPITLDENALAEAGITPDRTLSVNLTDAPIATVLERSLADAGLVYTLSETGVLITTKSRKERP